MDKELFEIMKCPIFVYFWALYTLKINKFVNFLYILDQNVFYIVTSMIALLGEKPLKSLKTMVEMAK